MTLLFCFGIILLKSDEAVLLELLRAANLFQFQTQTRLLAGLLELKWLVKAASKR
jgi:hypothetical protein